MSEIIKATNNYQKTCDGFNCEAEATEPIEVRIGKFGVIELILCKNCACKFWGSDEK